VGGFFFSRISLSSAPTLQPGGLMSAIIDSFIAPPCHDIEILWQDEHLLLINKPSGLLSLSGKNRKTSILSIIVWFRRSRLHAGASSGFRHVRADGDCA
jgi:23S rRNA-/tRNA-specific pseudouridylate synthase